MSDAQIYTLIGMAVVTVLFFGALMLLHLHDEVKKLDENRQQRNIQGRRDTFNRLRNSLRPQRKHA